MNQQALSQKQEISGLYGYRVIMCLIVANFHIWQQGWLQQGVRLFGKWISFDYITRTGYMMVDGLILLSGFLLFLPYARCMVEGSKLPGTGSFYFKRLVRIVPSYVLAVLAALFFIALPQRLFSQPQMMWKELLSHLTLTQTFFYQSSNLNGVLWTVCIEMQFYLLFPLLAKCARRSLGLTLGGMALAAWLYRALIYFHVQNTGMYINQMPAFLDVFALGMMGAMVYTRLRKRMDDYAGWALRILKGFAVVFLVVSVLVVLSVLKMQVRAANSGIEALRLGQLQYRLPLTMGLLGCILGLAFLPRPLEWLFGNRLMRFLAGISYNFYIWHQIFAVQIASRWFGYDALHSTPGLQKAYTLLCFSVAMLMAMVVTYGVERPAARFLQNWLANRTKRMEKENEHERPQTDDPQ